MKKLLITLVALVAVYAAKGQDLAQIAKQQIESHVKLPCEIAMAFPELVDSLQLDRVTMQLLIKPSGKVKQSQITFPKPTLTPILLLFVEATKKVRVDKELITAPAIILVDFRLKLEDLHSTPNYGAQHGTTSNTDNLAYNAVHYNRGQNPMTAGRTPNAKANMIAKEISGLPRDGSINNTGQRISDIDEFLGSGDVPSRIQFGKGVPRYMVTLVKD